ncbi:MAG: flagellar hook capping FlgD N-terminal domain-containing protein [Suilimivivens sp.]
MSVGAVVKDGQIQETASQSSVQKSTSSSGMDKDAFLQLLVAQMKYQDPLEPTSNTEYISQYATFSQVEQLQNMSATLELSRASSMVGKLVNIQTTDSNGNIKQVQGTVEYVTYENNKAYVSVDGSIYSADDVVAIVDETYQDAYDLGETFAAAMEELPLYEELTLNDQEAVSILQEGFNSMTAYQQSFISKADVEKLQKYVARIAELLAQAEENKKSEETDETEETDKTEEIDKTEETDKAEESAEAEEPV